MPSGTPASQMQQLMDQRNRTPQMPSTTVTPMEQGGPPNALQPGTLTVSGVWRGLLSWRGVDSGTNQKREMQTWVVKKGGVDQERVSVRLIYGRDIEDDEFGVKEDVNHTSQLLR